MAPMLPIRQCACQHGRYFHHSVFQTSLDDFITWKKDHPVGLIGAVCADVPDYRSYNYERDMLLFMGANRKGCRRRHRLFAQAWLRFL
jgi:tRNA G18 (ribose-2'-O)-methylase SpoU